MATLQRRLAQGLYPPGAALSVADLAVAIGFSSTPVREALAWLAGAGVIDDQRGKGYSCWRVEVDDLIGLYDLQQLLVAAALDARSRRLIPDVLDIHGEQRVVCDDASGPGALIDATADVFETMVAGSGHRTLVRVHQALSTQLGNVRRAECKALEGIAAELDRLAHAMAGSPVLDHLLATYFERRRLAAPLTRAWLMRPEIYPAPGACS